MIFQKGSLSNTPVMPTTVVRAYVITSYSIHYTKLYELLGDSADNVPGVKGIGKVTAEKLLNTYETLENIYAHLDEVKPAGVQSKLRDGEAKAFMSKKLVTLREDLFDAVNWDEYDMDDQIV